VETKKRLTTVLYSNSHKLSLEKFCRSCQEQGYKNNQSLDAIKLEWCLDQGGQFFLTYIDDIVVSVSGCHPLPEIGKDVYRILFRGATLRQYQNHLGVMSKTHMTSIPFYTHIPLAAEWVNSMNNKRLVITTNWNNPNIVSMNKSHNVLGLLAKQGIVSCLTEKINLFYTEQTAWQLNIDRYTTARNQFKQRNGLDD
jgi:hypothetical protein